ncbi:MAG: hypothetical protein MHM6MM_008789 [Cercozoa sp. M6MM]
MCFGSGRSGEGAADRGGRALLVAPADDALRCRVCSGSLFAADGADGGGRSAGRLEAVTLDSRRLSFLRPSVTPGNESPLTPQISYISPAAVIVAVVFLQAAGP